VVRADSPAQTLEDTFGGVVGYTLEDSMSGCIALRRHLLPYRSSARPRLYRESVGGLVNARRVIEALVDGRIDIGPLDSYFHDLLRAGDPAFAAQVRVLATTPAAPIPPLVATAALAAGEAERLRCALVEVGSAVELAPQRASLLLAGIAAPDLSDYNVFDNILSAAREYPGIW
jgi:ABC-type phosphate/phosphonate transport system substrate-binding protein